MDKTPELLNTFMEIVKKTIDERENSLVKGVIDLNAQLTDQVENLAARCGVLEILQLTLFSALAETNPLAHTRIVNELLKQLDTLEKDGHQDTALVGHLRQVAGVNAASKPLLRLVPKKTVPPSDESHPQ